MVVDPAPREVSRRPWAGFRLQPGCIRHDRIIILKSTMRLDVRKPDKGRAGHSRTSGVSFSIGRCPPPALPSPVPVWKLPVQPRLERFNCHIDLRYSDNIRLPPCATPVSISSLVHTSMPLSSRPKPHPMESICLIRAYSAGHPRYPTKLAHRPIKSCARVLVTMTNRGLSLCLALRPNSAADTRGGSRGPSGGDTRWRAQRATSARTSR